MPRFCFARNRVERAGAVPVPYMRIVRVGLKAGLFLSFTRRLLRWWGRGKIRRHCLIELSEYDLTLCDLFAHESAKTQQSVEFGQRATRPRSVAEIARDNMIGKMGEVGVSRFLRMEFGVHIPVNYDVYSRYECDDNDITLNGWALDIKSTRKGRYLLITRDALSSRKRTQLVPDLFIQCHVPWDTMTDRPAGKSVDIIGCISTERLTHSRDVYHLRAGDCIPGTRCKLQADNYAVRYDDLSDLRGAVAYMLKNKPRHGGDSH